MGKSGLSTQTFYRMNIPISTAGLDLIMISETADPPVVKVRKWLRVLHTLSFGTCTRMRPPVASIVEYIVGGHKGGEPRNHRRLIHHRIPKQTNTPAQIIDYGKYKYSQEKKKKEQKKKAKTTEVKEVKMSYKIENHDYGVRMKQVRCGLWFGIMDCC